MYDVCMYVCMYVCNVVLSFSKRDNVYAMSNVVLLCIHLICVQTILGSQQMVAVYVVRRSSELPSFLLLMCSDHTSVHKLVTCPSISLGTPVK